MLLNFIDFASNYKVAKKRLTCQLDNIILRTFPVILDRHSAGRFIMVLHQTRWVVVLGGHCAKWSIVVSNQTNWVVALGGHHGSSSSNFIKLLKNAFQINLQCQISKT